MTYGTREDLPKVPNADVPAAGCAPNAEGAAVAVPPPNAPPEPNAPPAI